jgi:signal transduction histidine kinase/ActR/RegA family two-component response regulator
LKKLKGIRTRLFSSIGALTLLFVIILIVLGIAVMGFIADGLLVRTIEPLTRSAAVSLENDIQAMAARLELLGEAFFPQGAPDLAPDSALLEQSLAGGGLVWLGFYSPQGVLLSGSPASPASLTETTLHPQPDRNRKLVLGDILPGPSGPELTLGIPLEDRGRLEGFLTGCFVYQNLNRILSAMALSFQENVFIIDHEGRLKIPENQTPQGRVPLQLVLTEPAVREVAGAMLREQEGSRWIRVSQGRFLASYSPVRNARWSLGILVPPPSSFLPLHRMAFWGSLVFLVCLIFFAFISNAILTSLLTRPLGTITEQARSLAEGNFEPIEAKALTARHDEIGILSRTFNTMSGAIEELMERANQITQAARSGRLEERCDPLTLPGSYQKIAADFNATLDQVCLQLESVPDALAFFDLRGTMLYRNRIMEDFLIRHELQCPDPERLARILSGGERGEFNSEILNFLSPEKTFPDTYTSSVDLPGYDIISYHLPPEEVQEDSGSQENNYRNTGAGNYLLTLKKISVDGGQPCVMLILSDVTMLIRSKLDAESASQAKSDFLSRMSHEIRTPLNAIIGMTQIAKSTDQGDKIKNCLAQIENSSNHLIGIINDILDYNKIESGKLSLDEDYFDLRANLDFVVSMMSPKARERGIDIHLSISNLTHSYIHSDSLRLNQVLINILSNAVKFSPEKSSIELNAREMEYQSGFARFYFEIVDHGIGISEKKAAKLFRPFEQADGSITRNYGGTGLGLAISKNLVEMMGGSLNLQSRENEGSAFSFTIVSPAQIPPRTEAPRSPGETKPEVYDFTGKRCLVVDDIEINREIITELLSDTGILIECAGNGQEAVDLFRDSPPGYFDLVLMDMQMPVMDGCTATRAIRYLGREDSETIPIIAMTANVMQEDIRKAMESGMDAHLGKPIELDAMYKVLQEHLTS